MIDPSPIVFFRWQGYQGKRRRHGKTLALNADAVILNLKQQQICLDRLETYTPSRLERWRHQVTPNDIQLFTLQMTTLLGAGLSIVQALSFLTAKHQRASQQILLLSIEYHISNGTSLASALRRTHRQFDGMYADLIEVGELSGNLVNGFTTVLTYLEKQAALRKKILKASIYPTMVICTALLLMGLMLITVIPEFEHIYQSLNAPLPTFTQTILSLSHQLRHTGPSLLITIVLITIGGKYGLRRFPRLHYYSLQTLLHWPLIGDILTKIAITQLTSTFSTCYNSGLSILICLDTATKATQNSVFSAALMTVRHDVSAGKSLYSSLFNTGLFPELMLQMVLIGEESGTLGEMFAKIATNYQQDVDHFVDNLGKIIEPLIILFLGVLVGGLVMAMYLPIFSLMDSF